MADRRERDRRDHWRGRRRKTVAAALDGSSHTLVCLANPMVVAGGIHHHLVIALGGVPRFHGPR